MTPGDGQGPGRGGGQEAWGQRPGALRWHKRFGSMGIADTKRVKTLEAMAFSVSSHTGGIGIRVVLEAHTVEGTPFGLGTGRATGGLGPARGHPWIPRVDQTLEFLALRHQQPRSRHLCHRRRSDLGGRMRSLLGPGRQSDEGASHDGPPHGVRVQAPWSGASKTAGANIRVDLPRSFDK